jgi:hypothetical protein
MNPAAMPPARVPARNSHSALANSADSSAARHASSSGNPVVRLRRAGSRADAAWLMAEVMKIPDTAAPIQARLCRPSVPCRKAGTRLLNKPNTLNAANTPRHAPSMTARMGGGTARSGRRLTLWSGLRTVSGMAAIAASASAKAPR